VKGDLFSDSAASPSGPSPVATHTAARLRDLASEFERRAAIAATLSGKAHWAAAGEVAREWADREDGGP
jgi:hypothetical protein